jgi:branched-chain amino acid transport system permease protein
MNSARSVPVITVAMLVTWLVLASVPSWIEKVGLYQYLGVEILIFAIYALAYNLVLGHAGLPSFGHGAFFGIGAYAFGLAQHNVLPNLWFCLGVATLAAAVAGLIVALFISHRRGIYYALMTIAFGQIFWFVAIKATSITGGEDGLLKIERLPVISGMASLDLKSNIALYYFVFAVFVVVSVFLWRLVHSPFGRIVKAIKQNEMRARFVGYNVWRYKAAILTLSAGLSGMAGGLFAMAQNSAFPDVMSLHYSGYVVMMTLVGGGLVSYWGPVIGAAAFFLARDVIGAVTTGWMLWFGLSFVILVLFKPEGIAGIFESVPRRERSGPVASGVAPHSVAR